MLKHARTVLFALFQFLPLLAIWTGVSWGAFLFCCLIYSLCVFGVTAGYHRYFSHRSFSTSRPFQFLLAVLGSMSIQKGVLWWSSTHRDHHRYSDKKQDPHSPIQKGFWWSHIGWIFSEQHMDTAWHRIKDMAKFPELRWIDKYWILPYFLLCLTTYLVLGTQYLVWGCFIAVFMCMHATFCINSITHLFGKKTYKTSDESRNIFWLGIAAFGEGFHCNHHYYPASVRQGFRWYEFDISYYILCVLEKFNIVWDLHRPSDKIINNPDKMLKN